MNDVLPAAKSARNPAKPLDENGREVQAVLAALAQAESVLKIRPASLWALRLAVQAAMTDGLGGELTITIPPKTGHPVEVAFSTGVR